jgi:hypothetical protein
MALELVHEVNDTGATASYWRVLCVNMGEPTLDGVQVHVEVGGYLDADARLGGKRPLAVVGYDVDAAVVDTYFGDASFFPTGDRTAYNLARECAYRYLKAAVGGPVDFSQSVDC